MEYKKTFIKWPEYFPKIMYVLEKLEDNDPFFRPGSSYNQRRYYNLHLHLWEKNKKRPDKRIIFICILFSFM